MYRNWGAVAAAASMLLSTAAFGGTDSNSNQGALPAGKPATVKQAEMFERPEVIALGAAVLIGGAVAIATTGGNSTATTTGTTAAP